VPTRLPAFVIGYHGCDKKIGDAIVAGDTPMRKSENSYDWLGNGFYFWEGSYHRALHYAQELAKSSRKKKPKITHPSVIGAVLDLGNCLNLLDHQALELVQQHHELLEHFSEVFGDKMPENLLRDGSDLLLRHLDCAVIELLHDMRKRRKDESFDSVRSVFVEGGELYKNAGFHAKNHIQICMRNYKCIKGFFHPRDVDDL
jgi:hypothetical protein